jgi:C4-type Zn-finger protein
MVQVWKCDDCGYTTADAEEAGDHERENNNGELAIPAPGSHFMDDLGE